VHDGGATAYMGAGAPQLLNLPALLTQQLALDMTCKSQRWHAFDAGDVLGEMAFFTDIASLECAVCDTVCRTMVITRAVSAWAGASAASLLRLALAQPVVHTQ
jgi:hypothetical protein